VNRAVSGVSTKKKKAIKKAKPLPKARPKPRPKARPKAAPRARSKPHGAATAAAILGRPASAGVKKGGMIAVKPQWAKYYVHLLELRDQLTRQRDGRARESAEQIASYSLHMADSGTDNFDRDFALSLLSADQDALYEIDQALKRIEKNTYGICELTGKPIPPARLEAIPWTRFTVQAQAQLEREGALRQRRLASLGSVDAAGAAEPEPEDEDAEEKSKEKE